MKRFVVKMEVFVDERNLSPDPDENKRLLCDMLKENIRETEFSDVAAVGQVHAYE